MCGKEKIRKEAELFVTLNDLTSNRVIILLLCRNDAAMLRKCTNKSPLPLWEGKNGELVAIKVCFLAFVFFVFHSFHYSVNARAQNLPSP